MKRTSLAASLLVAILIGGGAWFALSRRTPTPPSSNTNANTNSSVVNSSDQLSSTLTLNEYHGAHLTSAESAQLIADLHNVAKFSKPTSEGFSLLGDCGQSANVEILKKLDAQKTVQRVNHGGYRIVRTPNLQGWDMAAANQFMSDPTIVCGVGFFFPFEVTPQYILWRNQCSSGMVPTDVNGNLDPDFARCLQAEEAISKTYKLQD